MSSYEENERPLEGCRVLAVISGLELFGHAKGNIEVLKALREMGADVRVGVNARQDGGAVAEHLRDLGFGTFSLPFRPQWSLQWLKKNGPMYAVRHLRAVWACSWIFSRQVREFGPTHIHLGSPLAFSFISLALIRHRRIPLIWRMGDCPPVDSPFNLWIWRAGMKRATRVVAISEFVRQSAHSSGVRMNSISQIYNLAPSEKDSGEVCQRPPFTEEEFPLVYVGAIAEHKGLTPLVETFGELSRAWPGMRLWILGGSQWDGEFRWRLEGMVDGLNLREKVCFCGHVSDPDWWLRQARIHVAPSVWDEPLGNVVMEAKRAAVPSVVFPSGGLSEMVRHKVDGYVCKEKTAESLARAINWVMADPDRAGSMGASAREDYERRFGRERFMREWAGVYVSTTRP